MQISAPMMTGCIRDAKKMSFFWNLREYRDGDEHAIVELLKTVLPGWRSCAHAVEYWRWKYRRNPAGSPIIWLAEHNNRVIGHYGIIPVRMKVGNAYVNGSISCDGATHPTYQGKGVFSSIVNRCYIDAAEHDIPVTFMYANVLLGPTYKRYEWRGHICFMVDLVKILNWEPLLRKCICNESLAHAAAYMFKRTYRIKDANFGFKIERIGRFDERIDSLWAIISNQFEIIARKDREYLNWKYVECPGNEYAIYIAVKDDRILGYCVLDEEQRGNLKIGYIEDILGFWNDHNVISGLILKALECFREHDVPIVKCMISEKHPYIAIFAKAGFIPVPIHKRALCATINLRGSCIHEKEAYSQALMLSQNCFFKEKRNWAMVSGDGDRIPSLKYMRMLNES